MQKERQNNPPVPLEPKRIRKDRTIFKWSQGLGTLGLIGSTTACGLSSNPNVEGFSTLVFLGSALLTGGGTYGRTVISRFVKKEADKRGFEGKNLTRQGQQMIEQGKLYIGEGVELIESIDGDTERWLKKNLR